MAFIMKEATAKLSNHERTKIAVKAVAEALGKSVEELTCEVVGSTFISDKDDSDVDVLVYVEDGSLEEMIYPGWTYGGSKSPNPDCWVSWVRIVDGVTINMLVVTDRNYYDSWLKAADVCRFLHLQGYKLRNASVHGIHEIIMEDSDPETENITRWCEAVQ